MATARTDAPHERLAAAIAAGLAPAGMRPCALRSALTLWTMWRAGCGHDADALTPAAAKGFLDHRRAEEANPRTAFAQFADFQVAASLVWGAEAAAPLAAVLRESRMTQKAAPQDQWTRAAKAVAALPDAWRGPFETVLAESRARAVGAAVIWSADRIKSVAQALTSYRLAAGPEASAIPRAGAFSAWAEAMQRTGSALMSVAAYLSRVLDGFETVLTPGLVYDGPAAVANRWTARAESAPRRRSPTARTVPASELYDLGMAMMAEAEAAPIRRITEATLYRDGLLLALAAALPERARALSALAFDATLFLEGDGFIRLAIPAEALKRVERRKAGPGAHMRFQNATLHRTLMVWRKLFRPMFDDGDWLVASRLSREHPLTEASLGVIFRRVTLARLGRRISVHDIRGCVATEIIETDPDKGPARAAAILRHRDARVTRKFYDRGDGMIACADWRSALGRMDADRPDLDL